MGGGEEITGLNERLFAKHNSFRVNKIHLSIGKKLAEDLTGVAPFDPVEDCCFARRLVELDSLFLSNRELFPVKDGLIPCSDVEVISTKVHLRLT